MSDGQKRRYAEHGHPRTGVKHTAEALAKMKPTQFKKGVSGSPETEFKKGTPPEQHPRWKGGGAAYHRTNARKVIEKEYGIPWSVFSSKGLIVHHIDGNVMNNDPSNLALLERGMHTKYHRNGTFPKATKQVINMNNTFENVGGGFHL